MNDLSMTQLKILVERAVRSVRASISRKRAMREELLAHVSGVYEEEFAKLGDERAALERTALRFGDPTEVTSQLQESVPAGDRILRFWEGTPGESVLRGALRVAWVTAGFVLFVSAVLLLIAGWISAWWRDELIVVISCMAFLTGWSFAIAFVAHAMQNALHGPEHLTGWPRIGLIKSFTSAWSVPAVRIALIVGTASHVALLCVCKAIWPTEPLDWSRSIQVVAVILYAADVAATSVICAWVLVQSTDERRRHHAEWGSLPI